MAAVVIDLTGDKLSGPKRKRDNEAESAECCWVVIHRLEAGGYECIGDWSDSRGCLSHEPETFDARIVGIFRSRDAANRKAREFANRKDIGDDQGVGQDFVGEGRFLDGAESSGDVNTFSQRVIVERHVIQ